ncbi:hypothetical protein WJX72_007096 [[Myrmecia] bisecta]|uniref:Uncharacterized protein n=1 Tax=[Myrmecia] bisecta TaxID=41462 RepID=A0AAW1QRB0_9CHLO
MPPFWPKMVDMADHSEGLDLSKEQAVLMMCSTQGEGVPPAEARDFCEWFASDAAPRLEAVKFSVLALGDKSYTYFCATGKQLDGRAGELGGQRIADRVDVNREDWKAVDAWIAAVVAALPSLGLKTVAETGGVPTTAEPVAAKPKRWNKARPFYARVVALEGLCHIRKASDKDTIRVELDLGESGLQYIPGDALGILPYNCPQAVDDLVAQMGAEGGSLVAPPSWHYEESLELSGARQGDKLTLRDALCRCYDLRCPKPDLLRVLLDHLPPSARQPIKNGKTNGKLHIITSAKTPGAASNASVHSRSSSSVEAAEANGHRQRHTVPPLPVAKQAAKLQQLISSESAEAYLEERHVIDVLQDFAASMPPLDKVLACLRPLLPRLYSISSSMLEGPRQVQVTVAVVRYVSLGVERVGVTSTQLAERLQVGDLVPVYMHKNPDFRLPSDPATPIIMVGPGTGLAPFRSFMQERIIASQASGTSYGESVLFFGCRRRDQDFLYGEQLECWAAQGKLTLFTAFSREQGHKVYVQDQIRQQRGLVWRLLEEGAHFYVCGDAAHMAGSVETALLDIIAERKGSAAAANAYLDALRAQQRYQRDVWY